MNYRLTSIGLTAALALTLVACGDDSETSSGSIEPTTTTVDRLTAEEFATEANALCDVANEAVAAVTVDFDADTTVEDEEALISDTVVPSFQVAIDGISALYPPEDLQASVDQWLTDIQDVIDTAAADPSSLVTGDVDPYPEVTAEAVELGLTSCTGG